VSGVKKTVRWTVFSREVRSGNAARTDDARRSRGGIIPPAAPKGNPWNRNDSKGFLYILDEIVIACGTELVPDYIPANNSFM